MKFLVILKIEGECSNSGGNPLSMKKVKNLSKSTFEPYGVFFWMLFHILFKGIYAYPLKIFCFFWI
jgi:hypothetical protein